MYGSYATIEDTPTLIFERRLSHPVDRVWQAITDPDVLVHWFPSAVDVDLRVGGAMKFTFDQAVLPDGSDSMPGEVTELDPPSVFAFEWGEDHLRFERAASGARCTRRTSGAAPRPAPRSRVSEARPEAYTRTRLRKFRSPSHRNAAENATSTG
jgi:Activator of Hsp90 ATPase homolog 1-like protein